WSHWSGLMAAVTAAALLGGAFGLFFFATFLCTVGAPAWWLGYLALLGRAAVNGGGSHMEWYPPGRLVLWAAILGAALVAGALVIAAVTQTANLWLAGQVVKLSGRLKRPWPDLAALSLPPLAAALFATAVAGSLIPDLPGLVASLFAATLTTAFAIVGFAVMH